MRWWEQWRNLRIAEEEEAEEEKEEDRKMRMAGGMQDTDNQVRLSTGSQLLSNRWSQNCVHESVFFKTPSHKGKGPRRLAYLIKRLLPR